MRRQTKSTSSLNCVLYLFLSFYLPNGISFFIEWREFIAEHEVISEITNNYMYKVNGFYGEKNYLIKSWLFALRSY